jgi:pantoate--beta-alanine ligase
MKLIYKTTELKNYLDSKKSQNLKIGFVPTMGALHQGHLSLINRAKSENDVVVSSIFVNPTQFNDPKDFDKYPRTIDSDAYLLESVNCDILFLPDVEEMYQNPNLAVEPIDIGYLDTILEGEKRPGHYIGVVTIVEKLLLAVCPDSIYMGLKDYQQVKVVEKLIRDKNMNTKVIGCPTLREENGLAMSSRNVRLSDEGKIIAGNIYKTLQFIKENVCVSNPSDILEKAKSKFLINSEIEIEYLELRNAYDLSEVSSKIWIDDINYVVLFAGWLEGVRLIDNLEL